MNETTANPIYLGLMFVARCAAPLIILFGISYVLRKLGLVAETPPEKTADKKPPSNGEGDLAHDKA